MQQEGAMPEDGRFGEANARIRMQRAIGRAAVTLEARQGATRLVGLHQSGSAKAFLPRVHGAVPEVVFLNTSGGLTGGDRIAFALTLGCGARAVGTTQTAERAYASSEGEAGMEVALVLGAGAALDWLPQETILFDRSALARRTKAMIGAGARLLLAETVVLGRAAMGETLVDVRFTDWREVQREGVPVLVEPLRITRDTLTAGAAALGGMRAVSTVAMVAAGGEDALDAVRAVLPQDVEAAASAWDGKLVVRVMGTDLFPVKRAVARILDVVRGADLPRVWQT
jgi:urease accessory protein